MLQNNSCWQANFSFRGQLCPANVQTEIKLHIQGWIYNIFNCQASPDYFHYTFKSNEVKYRTVESLHIYVHILGHHLLIIFKSTRMLYSCRSAAELGSVPEDVQLWLCLKPEYQNWSAPNLDLAPVFPIQVYCSQHVLLIACRPLASPPMRPAALPQRFVSCPQIHNTVKVCGEWHIVISVSVFINVSQLKLEKYGTRMPSSIAGWEVYCISWSVSIVTPHVSKQSSFTKFEIKRLKIHPLFSNLLERS